MPVKLIKPRRFGDDRGWFVETYHKARWTDLGVACATGQLGVCAAGTTAWTRPI